MSTADFLAFLVLVSVGASVQSITGFAMGLIIMGGVTALHVADIAFSAAVVSIVSLVNTMMALRRTRKFIDMVYWRALVMGLLPMTVVGVFVLRYMSGTSYQALKIILGVVIISAGGLLMLKPAPFARRTPAGLVAAMGGLGGLISGIYGAGGAPLAWLMYRQPIDVNRVRATLLATFFVSTSSRTATIAITGELNRPVLLMALASVPVVIVTTLTMTRFAHLVPDKLVRNAVFVLLVLLGAFLIVR